jgi:hypothetical protein
MSDEIERWERVQGAPQQRQPFQARNSTASRHADPYQRRNLDKEEAARDRIIFRWALVVLSLIAVLTVLIFVARGMGKS